MTALVMFAMVSLYHLGSLPRTWFDEGMYLQTAKNLALTHTYAVRSADGTLDFAPAVGVGPTLILPIAAVFRLTSISLETARLVSVFYLLVATLLLYVIAKSLFGRLAATLTLVCLVGLPSLDWVATGRQALGEVPAVTFLLAGGLVAYRGRSIVSVLIAGLLLGLAMMTKGQYLLVLPATIVLLAFIDVLLIRRRGLRWFVALLMSALATYATWMFTILLIIGGRDLGSSYRQLRAASGGALLVFNLGRMEAALRLLVGPSSLMLVVPSVMAGVWWISRSSGERRERLVGLWIFQIVWMFWFVTASIGWTRYVFPALALNTVFMGALLAAFVQSVRTVRSSERTARWVRPLMVAGLTVLLVVVMVGVVHELRPLSRSGDTSPEAFARAVEATVGPSASVSGWEPEVGFFLNHPIQYPPGSTLNQVVQREWTSSSRVVDLGFSLQSDYLIVGPFARWVGVYSSAVDDGRYHSVLRVGDYELFQSTASRRAIGHDGGNP